MTKLHYFILLDILVTYQHFINFDFSMCRFFVHVYTMLTESNHAMNLTTNNNKNN